MNDNRNRCMYTLICIPSKAHVNLIKQGRANQSKVAQVIMGGVPSLGIGQLDVHLRRKATENPQVDEIVVSNINLEEKIGSSNNL
jgi:hypothetical protein